jgi:hypothetical protein
MLRWRGIPRGRLGGRELRVVRWQHVTGGRLQIVARGGL